MIDKNDVKMPVQRVEMEKILKDKQNEVQELLDLVNETENRQELRLKGDYYGRFNWFGRSNVGKDEKSYFSYQEEAVYDFIFNLNKSGILSDQVGMGKTIEAGMIVSELASRNELRSLLIIVPNEIMAKKWEDELESKFGIKRHTRFTENGAQEVYPEVKSLKNYDDFCRCVFDCIRADKFKTFAKHQYRHKYENPLTPNDTLASVIAAYVKEDIKVAIGLINEGLEDDGIDLTVEFDGTNFRLKGTSFSRPYVYDSDQKIENFIKERANRDRIAQALNNNYFFNRYQEIMKSELCALRTLLGDYYTTIPQEISALAKNIANEYPILVIPIANSEYIKDKSGDKVVLKDFLNRSLSSKIENYKHKYIVKNANDSVTTEYEDYRIVDFFIDVGYQTLIVDEVHDYIDVETKMERMQFHENFETGYGRFPSKDYNRYELFDDYYFIKKSSLYKKLKTLADKANRKIFLTATPIKSDMVDFYLLTLLASNKDAEAYRKISDDLLRAYPLSKKREETLDNLYQSFKDCIPTVTYNFCNYNNYYLAREKTAEEENQDKGRFKYPYFNSSFLLQYSKNEKLVKEYLLSQLSYMSMEEIVLELILAYMAEKAEDGKAVTGVRNIIEALDALFANETPGNHLQTKIVFRALLNNTIKSRFEEDFTTIDEKTKKPRAIKRIRELLELPDGARKWNKTYKKYGIRHTRHQTYNLAKCSELEMLSKNRQERYKNLPVWPRRDGKIIFVLRDDIFFDCFLDVKRYRKENAKAEILLEDLPNYDKLNGKREEKMERFNNATAIFNYINDAMSGGDPISHQPSVSKYDSVDLDDSGMVDYKLAMVSKLMKGSSESDSELGEVTGKVLLFAENNRDEIIEWFRYQMIDPYDLNGRWDDKRVDAYNEGLLPDEKVTKEKYEAYRKKWERYTVIRPGERMELSNTWKVSENAEDLSRNAGSNMLIIIDPKRYEKGVDLQKANTIINFDINYCPLKMEQRIGRIDRIRPGTEDQQINIISFVPLNDMSGFVINFFANEMKMFTQWMGETTGIVSVPEEDGNASATGEDISFEGKVYNLEEYYNKVYRLCKENVSDNDISNWASDFEKRFKTDFERAKVDFRFIQKLRPAFDSAFRNSISPKREGYEVTGKNGVKLMRFNTARGPFTHCGAENCKNCQSYGTCNDSSAKKRNIYKDFADGVKEFYKTGIDFYKSAVDEFDRRGGIIGGGNRRKEISEDLKTRQKEFEKAYNEVLKLLPQDSNQPFTISFDKYQKIFDPMKKLYWDGAVKVYIDKILDQFHKQCDSVLDGASLFEKFIKTLSIADFMNNMEGTV